MEQKLWSEYQVNTYTSGSYVILWQSYDLNSSIYRFYVQTYDIVIYEVGYCLAELIQVNYDPKVTPILTSSLIAFCPFSSDATDWS